ncbi:MAG: hypothetical protein ACREKH_03000 [Candidatus Rokuibacteriota bacterium]
MQRDLGAVHWQIISLTMVLLVVGVGLKSGAAAAGAPLLALSSANVAGILFNDRLTFGIITATVGLQEGPIDPALFSTILLVVLTNALLPMALRRDMPAEAA